MTRQRAVERSELVARDAPLLGRGDAVRRAPGDPNARHDRRQPGACRSGRRAAGRDAARSAPPSGTQPSTLADGCRRPTSSPGSSPPRSSRASCYGDRHPAAARSHRLRVRRDVAPPRRFRARRRGGARSRSTTRALHAARVALLSVGDRPLLADPRVRAIARPATPPSPDVIRAAAERQPPTTSIPERHPRVEPLPPAAGRGADPPRPRAGVPHALGRNALATCFAGGSMKIYDLSQPLNEQVSFWPYLPAVRGQVHQAQGRARRQRAVHPDVEPHGHAPRRAAPLRHRGHDHRRDSGRVAVRPRRASSTCSNEMDELDDLHAEDDRGAGRGAEGRSAVPAHRLAQARAVRGGAGRGAIHPPPSRRAPRHGAVAARRRRSTSGASTASPPTIR